MNNIKGKIAILILIISWVILFFLTGNKAPWYDFKETANGELTAYLGDVPIQNYDRMGFTSGKIKCLNKSGNWVVGTALGELIMFDNEAKILWKRTLGIGKLMSLKVSKDEKIVFVSEQSPDGQVFAINAINGNIVWKFATKNLVGSEPKKRSYPSVVHLELDEKDNVYVVAYRFLMNQDGERGYNSKVVSFTKNGKMNWEFPKKGTMDTWVNWCDSSDSENKLVFSTSSYEEGKGLEYPDLLYFLNKKTGILEKSVKLKALPPFKRVVMRGSPNFSKDGKILGGVTSDGRGYQFDSNGNILWQRNISLPEKIAGTWINASGRDAFVTENGVVFTTINTYNRANWQMPTPIVHPSSNSLFMFGLDGRFKYQYVAKGTIEQVSFTKDIIACAIGRNVVTHDYENTHGVVLLNLKTGKQILRLKTSGPIQAIDISKNEKHLGVIEAPAITETGKILGSYRLHIWNLKDLN